MESDMKNEVLLLTDRAGSYYAIPVGDLAAYRVAGESKDEIGQMLGADVEGYSAGIHFVLANALVDPESIFGRAKKQGAVINEPSVDPFVQAGRVSNNLLTFVAMIVNLSPPVCMPDILKRME